jgi:hypothetical protein
MNDQVSIAIIGVETNQRIMGASDRGSQAHVNGVSGLTVPQDTEICSESSRIWQQEMPKEKG